jgi:hypothetical protein
VYRTHLQNIQIFVILGLQKIFQICQGIKPNTYTHHIHAYEQVKGLDDQQQPVSPWLLDLLL